VPQTALQRLIADVRRFEQQLAATSKQIKRVLDEHGTACAKWTASSLFWLPTSWAAPWRVTGFTDAAAYANYTGTASVQIASAGPTAKQGCDPRVAEPQRPGPSSRSR
jgi:transposase